MQTPTEFTRHGGAYDRGSADRCYGRPARPHYYKGASYSSELVAADDMTLAELTAYRQGYDNEADSKDWGGSGDSAQVAEAPASPIDKILDPIQSQIIPTGVIGGAA